MRSVEEHLAVILATARPLGPFEVAFADAHGCALAEDVVAAQPVPPSDCAAVDGYAVRIADLAGAGPGAPVTLTVSGAVVAGVDSGLRVQPGFGVRIPAGAALPPGTEAVVPGDWTDRGVTQVRVGTAPAPGSGIRRAGAEVAAGALLLAAGTPLGAAQLGVLAAAGRARVLVQPRPRVVVFSVGAGLGESTHALRGAALPDTNGHTLAAAAREAGAQVYRASAAADDAAAITAAVDDHLIRADAVLVSGGVSPHEPDALRQAMSRVGSVEFTEIALSPGSWHAFGTVGPDAVPLFGLPAEPVAALVGFEVFVRPALRRMLGAEPLLRPQVRAAWAGAAWTPSPAQRHFVAVQLDRDAAGYRVRPCGAPDRALLSDVAAANGLAIVAEGTRGVAGGDDLAVMLLERRVR